MSSVNLRKKSPKDLIMVVLVLEKIILLSHFYLYVPCSCSGVHTKLLFILMTQWILVFNFILMGMSHSRCCSVWRAKVYVISNQEFLRYFPFQICVVSISQANATIENIWLCFWFYYNSHLNLHLRTFCFNIKQCFCKTSVLEFISTKHTIILDM